MENSTSCRWQENPADSAKWGSEALLRSIVEKWGRSVLKARWLVVALSVALLVGSLPASADEEVNFLDGIVWDLPFTYGLGASSWSGDDLPEWVPGIFTVGVRLLGDGNYLYISSYPGLHPPTLAVSFWVRLLEPIENEAVFIWAKERGIDGNGWIVRADENGVGMIVDGYNGFYVDMDPNEFFPLGEWVNVIMMFNSTTGEFAIYRNGVKQEKIRLLGTPQRISPNDGDILIGASPDGEGLFVADLDEFMIYNRFFNEAEIRILSTIPQF